MKGSPGQWPSRAAAGSPGAANRTVQVNAPQPGQWIKNMLLRQESPARKSINMGDRYARAAVRANPAFDPEESRKKMEVPR